MKKLIIAVLAFTTVSYASAQTSEKATETTATAVTEDAQPKTAAVKVEELPDAVKKTLAGDAYAGWKATSAVWVEAKAPYYEILLMRGEEKNVVKLSKEGNPIV